MGKFTAAASSLLQMDYSKTIWRGSGKGVGGRGVMACTSQPRNCGDNEAPITSLFAVASALCKRAA